MKKEFDKIVKEFNDAKDKFDQDIQDLFDTLGGQDVWDVSNDTDKKSNNFMYYRHNIDDYIEINCVFLSGQLIVDVVLRDDQSLTPKEFKLINDKLQYVEKNKKRLYDLYLLIDEIDFEIVRNYFG